MTTYQQTVLPNGLTVVSDFMAHVESVSVGVYIRAGARDEIAENNGVAHFLEHMAFKGTTTRTAQDIAREIENLGGDMNAYTSRETTAYHLKMLKEDLPVAVDVLADILQNSTFTPEEMARERRVILQEYQGMMDSPGELVFENLQDTSFKDSAMGRGILGSLETITSMQASDLRDFMDGHYRASNMVLAAAGHVDHEALVALAEKVFSGLSSSPATLQEEAVYTAGRCIVDDACEQVHVALGFKGVPVRDDLYIPSAVWSTAFGGGTASRLYQEVREKRGLVYDVSSFSQNFEDCGTFGVYGATTKDMACELLDVLRGELKNAHETLSTEDIQRAKVQLIASMRMAQESTDARMSRLARNVFIEGRFVPIEEVVADVTAVSEDDIHRAIDALTAPATEVLSVYGPVEGLEL